MTWNVWIYNEDGKLSCERADATGISISPDGALVFQDGPGTPPKAIYANGYWRKAEPSAIQSGKIN